MRASWLAEIEWGEVEWGTVPEAMTALATTLGFLFGLLILRRQLRAFEQAEVDRKVVETQRLQAERERRERHVRAVGVGTQDRGGGEFEIKVSNDFPAPIHNCYVKIHGTTGPLGDPVVFGTVEQGATRHRVLRDTSEPVSVTEIIFVDSMGTGWRKWSQSGRFEEMDS